MVRAMKLTFALGAAGEAPTAAYGHLEAGDDFSVYGRNHDFAPAGWLFWLCVF